MRGVLLSLLCLKLVFISSLQADSPDKLIQKYIRICEKYHQYSDTLIHYGPLLVDMNDNKARHHGYYALGYAYQSKLDIDTAIYFFQKGLEYVDPEHQYKYFARFYRNLAICEMKRGRHKKSIWYSDRLIKISGNRRDSVTLASAYTTKAQAHKMTGELEAAVSDARTSLEIMEKTERPEQVNSLFAIALIYVNMERDSLALNWFREAYRRSLKFDIPVLRNRALNNLGTHFRQMGMLDSSSYYYEVLLNNKDELRARQVLLLYQNLADNAIQLKSFARADSFVSLGYQILRDGNAAQRKNELLHVHSRLEEARGNYSLAGELLDSCIALAQKSERLLRVMSLTYHKSVLFEKEGKNKEALLALKAYQHLKDSISAIRDIGKIQEVVSEYELKRKEKQLAKAMTAYSDSKKRVLWIAILSFGLLGLAFWQWRSYRRSKLISAEIPDHSKVLEKHTTQFNGEDRQTATPVYQLILKSKAVISIDKLIRVESEGHYLNFHLDHQNKPEVDRDSLTKYAEELEEFGFFRSHRSHLLNPVFIKAVYSNRILMENGEEVPLSRTFKQKLKDNGHSLFS